MAAVRRVNLQAFAKEAEAQLVDLIRERDRIALALVAIFEGQIVGHLLFTPAEIRDRDRVEEVTALGPMAVLPAHQRSGIGTELVNEGLSLLRAGGHRAVIVLGHPNFYPRFGFVPARQFDIQSTYDVPDEVFMALELLPGSLQSSAGTVHYLPEFDSV